MDLPFPPMKHQEVMANKWVEHQQIFNGSDPGTGKTFGTLLGYCRLPSDKGRMLVLAPKSILQAAWGNDIEQFTPHLSYSVAWAGKKRMEAFHADTDIVIANHDAIKWVMDNKSVLRGFNTIVVDESTAFKNKNSQRTKALFKAAKNIQYRTAMSGTFIPQTVLDAWPQMYFIDRGELLGPSLYAFKQQVCTPTPVPGVPGATNWEDKPGAAELVADMIAPRTVRYTRDECLDLPENLVHKITYKLSAKHYKLYKQFKEEMLIELESTDITAVHAGALAQKMLQLISGAVYDQDGDSHILDSGRTNLVMDLVEARNHSVVAFNWHHQKDQLTAEADKRGIKYCVIDGTVSANRRLEAVERFQAGELQVIFAHPQSAGHGLTLTRGEATIWASPTSNSEFYEQFNARIYRAGQDKKTETILVAAEDTYEEQVYARLMGKVGKMGSLLETMAMLREAA